MVGDSRVSRRTLLGAAVRTAAVAGLSGGLSGCVAAPPAPPAQTQTQTRTDPLTPVLLGQQALRHLYQRVLDAFPELVVALTDLQAQTDAHTEALLAAAPAAAEQIAATAVGLPSASASGSASSSIPAPAPPTDVATALADLKLAVDSAAGSLRAAALAADGDLAALLGSCAASTACHRRVLA